MQTTTLFTRTGGTAALLVVAAVLATLAVLYLGRESAWADEPHLCPADRPCITEFSVGPSSALEARWSGDWDAYNIRWENPDLVKEEDVGDAKTARLVVLETAWNRTYRFSVQGCNRNVLAPSDCSPFAAQEITLHVPEAPRNARLSGDAIVWDGLDPQTVWVNLWGAPPGGGPGAFITSRPAKGGDPVQRMELPPDWRAQFGAVRVCAANNGGKDCSDWFPSVAPTPPPPPPPPDPCNPACRVPPAEQPADPTLAAPTNLSGTLTPDRLRVVLGWTAPAGATPTGYELRGSNADSGLFFTETLAADATGYTDEIGPNQTGAFIYELKACTAAGCSAPVTVTVTVP
jgi:hypothetical protein